MEAPQTSKIKHSITPSRLTNISYRDREHLTKSEIDTLLKSCRGMTRNGQRNYCIVLLGYKHGLRAVEFTYLRWESIDLDAATIYVRRAKGSDSGTHHLTGLEVRELRKLKRAQGKASPWVFTTETGDQMTAPAVSQVIKRMGQAKDGGWLLGFPIHAHMLRHTCGYLMTEIGVDIRITQAWLGHREVQNTVRYTKLSPHAYKGIDF